MGDGRWGLLKWMNKFSLGFFKRTQPHSTKQLSQDKPLQEGAKILGVLEHLHHSHDEFHTNPAHRRALLCSASSHLHKRNSALSLQTHQQHFWALLWMFVHVGNRDEVKFGGSLYAGLTLQCYSSQALTLPLETQSWISPSSSPSRILLGSLHGCSVLWSL